MNGANRETRDPILDTCVVAYREALDEAGRIEFKGTATRPLARRAGAKARDASRPGATW